MPVPDHEQQDRLVAPEPCARTRRHLLSSGLAAGGAFVVTGAGAARAAPAPATVRDGMPLLALNEGVWEGTYRFVTPTGELVDRYDFRIRVVLSDDNARAYRQETHYSWPDGRTEDRVFEAQYDDRALTWDDGRIAGRMWEIDDRTLYLTFGFASQPELRCFEMLQMGRDGKKRGRSWLWYKDEELYQVVLISERRVD